MSEPEEETEVEEQEVEGSKEKKPRSLTAYNMFIREQWLEFKANMKEDEKFSAAELVKEFGEEWRALSEEERQRYSVLADKHNEERGLNRTP